MLHRFKKNITTKQLFHTRDKLLLAISGGIDSVVLAHLLKVINADFALVHCNFQLRPEASNKDEAFVRNLATVLEVEIFVKHFDTKRLHAGSQDSIQMLARKLRYTWFEEVRQKYGFDYILTAHHAGDNLETLLLNLTRGTGISGLSGIVEKRGKIVRPLLFAIRQEIVQYAKENQIVWREDASNQDSKYRRNLIRNEILPLLKRLNPNLEKTFSENIEKFKSVGNIFKEKLEEVKNDILTVEEAKVNISIEKIEKLAEKTLYLSHILKPYGFSYTQSKAIIKSLDTHSGKRFYSSDYQLLKDRANLIITKKESFENKSFQIEKSDVFCDFGKLKLRLKPQRLVVDFDIPKSKTTACVDFDKLKFPLRVSVWQKGDYFYPLGMQGRQKVSDFLINQKMPLSEKSQVFVLYSEENIVWIVGYRLDDRYKITSQTTQMLYLEKV